MALSAASVGSAPIRAWPGLTVGLPFVRQPRSVRIWATPASSAVPEIPTAHPSRANQPASASNPLPSGSRARTAPTSSRASPAALRARAVGVSIPLDLRNRPTAWAVSRMAATGGVRSSRFALPIHQSLTPLAWAICSTVAGGK